jgi:FkbM family methyltransferase
VLQTLPKSTVHSFEPSGAAFAKLASTVAGNPRVSVHQLALSDTDGDAILYSNEPGSPLSSLTNRRLDHFGLDFSCQEVVHTNRLESWARALGISAVDVLKLDVEGHELQVLGGSEQFLDSMRVIQFEFGGCNIDTKTYFQDFWYLLTAAGFHIHRLGPAGLRAVDRYSERDEVFITTNYFASRGAG